MVNCELYYVFIGALLEQSTVEETESVVSDKYSL